MAKEQVRVASINLTKAGYEALGSLKTRTNRSRKDVVSDALVKALHGTMLEPVIRFGFTEPELLVELKKEVNSLEHNADQIRKALLSIKPRDSDQSERLKKQLLEIQQWLVHLDAITKSLNEKYSLLSGLTEKDYKLLPGALKLIRYNTDAAKTAPDRGKRLLFFELLERLILLVIPGISQPAEPLPTDTK